MEHNRALIVGVGADLPMTITDAKGIAAILSDPARCRFDPANVRTLTEAGATRDAILAALGDLAGMPADATAIIYFSGHGYTAKTSIGKSYFLMPYGYDLADLSETAISGREFADKLAAIPAERMLLLLDCCHAGGVADDQAKTPGLILTKAPLPPDAEALFARGSGRVVVCSSRADEVSLGGQPYSLFTRALIECLSGQGVSKLDGYVRALDLALHAREKVPTWSKHKQHPIADVKKADNFIVAYYAAGAKSPLPLDLPPVETSGAEEAGQPQASVRIGKIDLRGAQGPIIAPTGPVTQTFGPMITTGGGDFIGRDHIGDTTHGATPEQFAALLAELRAVLAQATLDAEEREIAEGELVVIEAQAGKPQPKLSVIEGKLSSIKTLIEGAAGIGMAATGLVQVVQRGIELAQQLFR